MLPVQPRGSDRVQRAWGEAAAICRCLSMIPYLGEKSNGVAVRAILVRDDASSRMSVEAQEQVEGRGREGEPETQLARRTSRSGV